MMAGTGAAFSFTAGVAAVAPPALPLLLPPPPPQPVSKPRSNAAAPAYVRIPLCNLLSMKIFLIFNKLHKYKYEYLLCFP
jgi:hypothetical protein